MRIKFGQFRGNSLTLYHFEKKARRTTDLVALVNYNSRPIQRAGRAPSGNLSKRTNQVIFVVFNTRKIAGKRCARLVRRPSLTARGRRIHRASDTKRSRSGAP